MRKEFKNHLITGILSSPIVYIPHFHYGFIDNVIDEIINPQDGCNKVLPLDKTSIIEFDIKRGVIDFYTKKEEQSLRELSDIELFLQKIVENDLFDTEVLFLFKNFGEALNNGKIQALLQVFAEKYERNNSQYGDPSNLHTIIIVNPSDISSVPVELENIITIVEITAPSEEEILHIVSCYNVSKAVASDRERSILISDIARNLQGLQLYDISQILDSATVRTGGYLTHYTKDLVLEEKKRVVKKSGIIEVVDADISFNDIGGLKKLQEDLKTKSIIYKHIREAQELKVSLPKGILIIGMPGCGKSMIAKAVASEFGVSLLRLDISRLMGQYVGQSEANLRKALATAEAAHPCVLWIDEIEKAFAGANSQQGEDMLVMRLMGHFLTWMQERKTPIYIVATANDVMRPEFMRKGRFDEVYFVNFPNKEERKQILEKKIEKYTRNNKIFDFSKISDYDEIVEKMQGVYGGFSGAEIESVVNSVIEKKFVLYVKELEESKKNPSYSISPIKILEQDFYNAIETIRHSVMAEQKSSEEEQLDITRKWTNIERIRQMQRTYHFAVATEGNDVDNLRD